MLVLLALCGITVGVGAESVAPGQGERIELELLLRHPKQITAELRTPSGRSLGRFEVLPVWEVVRPLVVGVPDSLHRETVLVFSSVDGRRSVLSLAEVMPPAPLPPLFLLRRVEGRTGDTVRVPVRASGRIATEQVEQAFAPAVRLRYRVLARLNRLPSLRFPALVVGADPQPSRWLSEVVRVDVLQPPRRERP
ncbi:MAG: hypothetical protein NZ473_03210 [Candidatus Kapabacteria bacterium]|nr:hypothetical protein [Candidatus Kapabacteria bacterium]MCS7170484.1 hypothetical protein [Candidatus Kapabacteria bacterium]MDW7997505.1 hypothetical protein [Bacteroidota bacterium]